MKKHVFKIGLILLLGPCKISAQTPALAFTSACANSSSLSGNPWSSTPAYQCDLPETSTAGDTLIFSFGFDGTGGNQNFMVSDDKGDTFTLDVSSAISNNKQLRIYRAVNIAAGATYVRVTLNGGQLNGYWQPTVSEFYGAAVLDASSCATGTSTSVTAGSLAPTFQGFAAFFGMASSILGTLAPSPVEMAPMFQGFAAFFGMAKNAANPW